MSKMQMTRGKFNNINACADKRGVIAAAAMDQRGSLQNTIAKARGADIPVPTDVVVAAEFKADAVATVKPVTGVGADHRRPSQADETSRACRFSSSFSSHTTIADRPLAAMSAHTWPADGTPDWNRVRRTAFCHRAPTRT